MEKEERIKRVKEILKSHGIEMEVSGCGCCGSPYVDFSYLGEKIVEEEEDFNFNTSEV